MWGCIPSRVGDDHGVGQHGQSILDDGHLQGVTRRQVPQNACERGQGERRLNRSRQYRRRERRQTGGEIYIKTTPGQKPLKYLAGFSEQHDQTHKVAHIAVLTYLQQSGKPL